MIDVFTNPGFWVGFIFILIGVYVVMWFLSGYIWPVSYTLTTSYPEEKKPGSWLYHDDPVKAPPGAKFHFGSEDTIYGLRIMEVHGDTTSARMDYWRIDLGWNSTESVTLTDDEMQALIDTVQ